MTHDENQRKVDVMIQENRRVKQRDIALKLGISQERVHHINETGVFSPLSNATTCFHELRGFPSWLWR
jgi:hypothetical protein